jgi:hypothetical protein
MEILEHIGPVIDKHASLLLITAVKRFTKHARRLYHKTFYGRNFVINSVTWKVSAFDKVSK